MKRAPSSAATQTREVQVTEEAVLTGSLDRGSPTQHRLNALLHERDRLSRDLHDCVVQSLYAIGLSVETARRLSPNMPPAASRSSACAVEQINRLIREIRGLIQHLNGGTIPAFDFRSELQAVAKAYEEAGHLSIHVTISPDALDGLTPEIELELLNLAREALSNCVRHAKATHATVSICMRGTRVHVAISDDGSGLVATASQPRGYGLVNMEARAKKLGGTLRMQSRRGEGTRVIAEFALEPILTPI